MVASRREAAKKAKRYADAKATAEKQKRGFDLSTLKLPEGVKRFAFKDAKKYRLLVYAYEVKHDNPNCDDGLWTWERTYYAHTGLGADGKRSYVCPAKENGEPCAVHDEAQRLRKKGGDAELIKSLEYAKKRQLIPVVDLDDKESGVQVYEGPYNNGLGKLIDAKISGSDDDSPNHGFFHEDHPMKLIVMVEKESFKTGDGEGGSFNKPVNVEMEPIKPEVYAQWLDQVPCLDDCLDVLEYDQMKKILDQTGSGETEEDEEEEEETEETEEEEIEDEDETPAPKGKKKPPEEEEDEDDEPPPKKPSGKNGKKEKTAMDLGMKKGQFVMHDDKECEIVNISKDGTSLTLEDEDGDEIKGVDPNECELVKTKTSSKDEDEDEDEDLEDEDQIEDDPDEDDEPPAKPSRKPGKK